VGSMLCTTCRLDPEDETKEEKESPENPYLGRWLFGAVQCWLDLNSEPDGCLSKVPSSCLRVRHGSGRARPSSVPTAIPVRGATDPDHNSGGDLSNVFRRLVLAKRPSVSVHMISVIDPFFHNGQDRTLRAIGQRHWSMSTRD
jgi:hypothetical protein